MESFDLLIYAAITAFLAYRLWSVLGQRDEDEPGKPPRPNPFARAEVPSQDEEAGVVEGRSRLLQSPVLTPAGHALTSLAGTLDQVRAIDPTFDEKKFLEGARGAFSRIVAAFAAGDMTPVQRFLGGAVIKPFEEAIRARKAEGQTLENRVERFAAVDIVGAQTQGSLSTLSVEFVTHQVNVLRDASGQVIGGIVGKAEEVRDIWVFRRDMKAADPNWQLIETRS